MIHDIDMNVSNQACMQAEMLAGFLQTKTPKLG